MPANKYISGNRAAWTVTLDLPECSVTSEKRLIQKHRNSIILIWIWVIGVTIHSGEIWLWNTFLDAPALIGCDIVNTNGERRETALCSLHLRKRCSRVFTYVNSFLYDEDYDTLDEDTRQIMQEGIAAFVASRPSTVFCRPQCKNRHNVYKSRAKNKNGEGTGNERRIRTDAIWNEGNTVL